MKNNWGKSQQQNIYADGGGGGGGARGGGMLWTHRVFAGLRVLFPDDQFS